MSSFFSRGGLRWQSHGRWLRLHLMCHDVPLSSRFSSFTTVFVFVQARFDGRRLVLGVHIHSPSAFASSLVQHSPCLETRNIEETNQCRSVSPWLWLSLRCAAGGPWLPGCGRLAAAPRHFALAMPAFGTSLFPCPRVRTAGNTGTCAGQACQSLARACCAGQLQAAAAGLRAGLSLRPGPVPGYRCLQPPAGRGVRH